MLVMCKCKENIVKLFITKSAFKMMTKHADESKKHVVNVIDIQQEFIKYNFTVSQFFY